MSDEEAEKKAELDQQVSLFEQLGIELSEEEQKILNSLKDRLNKVVSDDIKPKEIDPKYKHDPLEDPLHPRHVTDYPRELRIMIDIEMSSKDKETGALTEVITVLQNWYHIPILENTDYTEKAGKFIDALEQETNTLAYKIHFNETPETQSDQPEE